MRYVATFLIGQAAPRIWRQEVAEKIALATYVSDGNIPNENKHPNTFISMIIASKSYSEVNSFKNMIVSFIILLLPYPILVTSHRYISILTGKSLVLSGQWRCDGSCMAEAIRMALLVLLLDMVRTNPVTKTTNRVFVTLLFFRWR